MLRNRLWALPQGVTIALDRGTNLLGVYGFREISEVPALKCGTCPKAADTLGASSTRRSLAQVVIHLGLASIVVVDGQTAPYCRPLHIVRGSYGLTDGSVSNRESYC